MASSRKFQEPSVRAIDTTSTAVSFQIPDGLGVLTAYANLVIVTIMIILTRIHPFKISPTGNRAHISAPTTGTAVIQKFCSVI